MYHTTGLSRDDIVDLCAMMHAEVKDELRTWPPILGLFKSVVVALFLQARGELRTQLKLALRTGRARRVPHGSTRPKHARIAGMVNISERTPEAEDRAVPGHWEGM